VSGFKDTFLTGWHRSLNLSLLLPLYMTGLLFGLVQTWPLLVNVDWMTRPQLGYLAAGDLDAWVNLLLGNREAQTQIGANAVIWLSISQLLLALYGLAYNFFTGGILSVWAGTHSFWTGCRYTFWTFVGLGLLLLVLVSPVVLITIIATSILGSGALVLGVVLLLLINLLGEYARSIAVVRSERNPFKLIGSAFMFSLSHFGGVISLGGLGTALHFGVVGLYFALGPLVSGTVALVLVQQVIVLLWLWVKLLRLAWALSYVQTTQQGMAEPQPAKLRDRFNQNKLRFEEE
jgi:hypothetical protein